MHKFAPVTSQRDYKAAVKQSATTPQVFLMYDSKLAHKADKEMREIDLLMKSDKMLTC